MVKIKNINKSCMKKLFVVKGRVKYINVEPNKNSSGSHLNAIIFDDSSEIEVVAFNYCENIAKLLQKNNVVTIENCKLKEVNKYYKRTKHKYQIILMSVSIITIVNSGDFPHHKYTSGVEFKTLTSGMIIDVIGLCCQIDSERTVNGQKQIMRKGRIMVDSIQIDVRFFGDKVDVLYDVGSALLLTNVTYINYMGFTYLSVGDSSSVQYNTQQLSNDLTIELPDQKLLTSSITQSNNNSTIELPEKLLSTSSINQSYRNLMDESIDESPLIPGSTPSNKRKTHDFKDEEVNSKFQKKTHPDETFSNESFINTVMNFMQTVDNNKSVIQLRILEFISKLLKENKKNSQNNICKEF
ncbi:hypothetical protein QTP88_014258 [Uroleucon formosanum]